MRLWSNPVGQLLAIATTAAFAGFPFAQIAVLAQSAPVNLDLGAGSPGVELTDQHLNGSASAIVNIGGQPTPVRVGDVVTPAVFAALNQIVGAGRQTLVIDGGGRAVGGNFVLNNVHSGQLTNLIIPANVTALHSDNLLSVQGNLFNAGTLLGIQAVGSTFNINAGLLRNDPTGLISTFGGNGAVNLSIVSASDIINHGTIASSGTLSMVAAGNIHNSQSIAAVLPTISAVGNNNLQALSGTIVNNGAIESLNANLALTTAATHDLKVENTNGSLSALAGEVTLRDSGFIEKQTTELIGGDIRANALKVNGGDGITKVFANRIDADIDINAGEAHVRVDQGDLRLMNMTLTGDPTIVNTDPLGGDIILSGNINPQTLQFPGESLAVIATGDIIGAPGLNLIDLSSPTGHGGKLALAAGFRVTPNVGSATSGPGVTYTLQGPSVTGGDVILPGVELRTSATAAGKNGGQVAVVAHDSSPFSGKGTVEVGAITTTSLRGTGGNVLLVAQSGKGPVRWFEVNAPIQTSGLTSSGFVRIAGAEPRKTGVITIKDGVPGGGGFISAFADSDPAHPQVNVRIRADIETRNFDKTGSVENLTSKGGIVEIFSPKGVVFIDDSINIRASGDLIIGSQGSGVFVDGFNTITTNGDLTIATEGAASPVIIGSSFRQSFISSLGDMTIYATDGEFIDGGNNAYLALDGSVQIAAKGYVSLADRSGIGADHGILLYSATDKIYTDDTTVLIGMGVVGLIGLGGIEIGPNNIIQAGNLGPSAPATGLLKLEHAEASGYIVLLSGTDINIRSGMNTVADDMLVLAYGGDINMSPGLTFNAHGGSITMFANDQINGDGITMNSRAMGTPSRFSGGLIQLSTGISFSPTVLDLGPTNQSKVKVTGLTSAIKTAAKDLNSLLKTNTFVSPALDAGNLVLDPTIMGANVLIDSNGLAPGVVLPTKIGGGIIDLSGSSLSLSKGAVFLEAVGAGSEVNLTNSTLTTHSYGLVPTGSFTNFLKKVDAFLFGTTIPIFKLYGSTINSNDQNSGILFQIFLNGKNDHSSLADDGGAPAIKNSGLLGSVMGSFLDDGGRRWQVNTDGPGQRSAGVPFAIPLLTAGEVHGLNSAGGPTTIAVGDRRTELMLFTTTNQVLRGDFGGTTGGVIAGQPGTTVSANSEELVVHNGEVVTESGKGAVLLTTAMGTVRSAPDTTTSVNVVPGEGVHVRAISGGEVTVGPQGGSSTVILQPGEELILEESKLKPIAATEDQSLMPRAVGMMGKGKFAPVEGTKRTEFLQTAIRLSGSRSTLSTRNPFLSTGITASREIGPTQINANPGTLLTRDKHGALILNEGAIFFRSTGAEKIKTSVAEIDAQPGALLSIDLRDGKLRVRSCSGPGHVVVRSAKHNFPLSPGQEVLVSAYRPTRSDALGDDQIGRRRLEVHHLDGETYAVTGDYSMISLLKNARNLQAIKRATAWASEETMATLMKMSACVELATAGHGRFYVKPKETAHVPDWIFTPGSADALSYTKL